MKQKVIVYSDCTKLLCSCISILTNNVFQICVYTIKPILLISFCVVIYCCLHLSSGNRNRIEIYSKCILTIYSDSNMCIITSTIKRISIIYTCNTDIHLCIDGMVGTNDLVKFAWKCWIWAAQGRSAGRVLG